MSAKLFRGEGAAIGKGGEAMTKLIAIAALALAFTTSAQAMPLTPPQQPDGTVITVREACGPGMRRTANGNCIRTHARRAASRCARGVTC
jgi:hypothetical protein